MKKILSLIAAGAMALGLIGCSGDLHDDIQADSTILAEACIVGINGCWDQTGASGNILKKVDDTTYTYTFTTNAAAQQFSIVEKKGSWASRWCGNNAKGAASEPETTAIAPGGKLAAMVYSTEADPTHVQISGLGINSEYMITIKIVDPASKAVSCKIELTKAGEAPSEYSWKDLTLKGGWEGSWADRKTLTDAAIQEFTVTAANPNGNQFGIFGTGANLWEVKDLVLGTRTEMTFKDANGTNSTMAEDWVAGATYKFKLELTDTSLEAPKAYITVTKE
ncbi:MAG: hypothetical protein MSA36_00140 [Treponema porcinum]|uniref:hypothetical protein n=1 Tax=Treponema porcinum TaxID=261392 RepID=UPI002357346E|nr:hypothetical protein [Treponema porcinum]MCI7533392.1 hypothetical protein [Treponema porcinum]